MKIIAIMMVFNCGDVVGRALTDLDGRVDEIHCFDGRWSNVSCRTSAHSTDDTKEVIKKFTLTSKSKVKYHLSPIGIEEYQARTFSLSCAQNGDWIFVFDADERLIEYPKNLRVMLEQSNERGYMTLKDETKTPHSVCRLYKKMEGIHYHRQDKVYAPDVGTYNAYYMRKHFKMSGIVILNDLTEKRRMPHASDYVVKHRQQHPHP